MRGRFVLLAMLAVLIAATACSGQAATPTTTPSSTSPTSTTTPTVSSITTTTAAAWLAWSRAPMGEAVLGGPGTQAIVSVTAEGPGLVAVGVDNSGDQPDAAAVWVSDDGYTWTRINDPAALGGPGTQILSVMAGGPGLVAVGVDNSSGDQPEDWDAAVWVSVDGHSWTRIHDPVDFGGPGARVISSLAVGGPGLVAVGHAEAGGDEDAAVWVSVDGYAWTRVDDEALSAPGGQAMNVAGAWRGGLVAFGVNDPGANSEANAIWVSVDGYTWTRIDDPAMFGEPGTQQINCVVAGGPGLVAGGTDESSWGEGGNAALWVSADGYTWTRITDEAFGGPGNQGITSLAVGGPGLVAAGWDYSGGTWDAALWVSADGYTWTRITDEAFGGPGSQVIGSVTAWGPGFVAAGYEDFGGGADAAVWVATPATP